MNETPNPPPEKKPSRPATLRVLVACEFSGVVRDAFQKRGHEAYSCDLLPTESDPEHHIVCDHDLHILDVMEQGWDLMIAHPPCTHLAVSGARYFEIKRQNGQQEQAINFFMALTNAPIKHICIENPVGIMSSHWRKPDQIIQPWQFGHPESKATCLWLKNLRKLIWSNVLPKPKSGRWSNQTPSGQNKLGPSPDRAANRSRTYQGIAEAMATQWGAWPVSSSGMPNVPSVSKNKEEV